LLEEGQQNSSSNPFEAHPQLATQVFGFEKDFHLWQVAKVVAENGETPNKRPTIWM